MAIRIEKDEEYNNQRKDNFPGNGGNRGRRTTGGGGGIGGFLPILLMLFRKNPKLAILGLLAFGAYYLYNGGCSNLIPTENSNSTSLSTGLEMSSAKYAQAEVYEPLANNRKNPLPEKVSLEKYAPKRLNQGRQGSCVGWASSYAARTILHSRATGENPDDVTFSPSHLYNKIALKGCQGSYLLNAMKSLHEEGNVPFKNFPYDESSCSKKGDAQLEQYGKQFRTKGYNRLTKGDRNKEVDMLAMKQNLAQGAPVVIGMMVGGSFMRPMEGQEKWIPTDRDYQKQGFGGHAMCVIGYDDYKFGNEGGFQIMNSWGNNWGDNGIGWVRYKDFEYFTVEAWGLYPMGNADQKNADKLAVNFGLVDKKTGRNIPLKYKSGNVFETGMSIKPGQKFKVEFTNSIECYVYVFGKETNGSTYTLFPYTKKHSPYCGITGTRLFPKDHSLVPDADGTRDEFAIIVTKEPIDYVALNEKFNSSSSTSFAAKINTALAGQQIVNAQFGQVNDTNVGFSGSTNGKNAIACIIEVDKR